MQCGTGGHHVIDERDMLGQGGIPRARGESGGEDEGVEQVRSAFGQRQARLRQRGARPDQRLAQGDLAALPERSGDRLRLIESAFAQARLGQRDRNEQSDRQAARGGVVGLPAAQRACPQRTRLRRRTPPSKASVPRPSSQAVAGSGTADT